MKKITYLIIFLALISSGYADRWMINSTIISGINGTILSGNDLQRIVIAENLSGANSKDLIYGMNDGTLKGFTWNGNGWTSASSVVNGLGDLGINSAPTIVYDLLGDGQIHLITSTSNGIIDGYLWKSNIWVQNSTVAYDIGDLGDNVVPEAIYNFSGNNKWTIFFYIQSTTSRVFEWNASNAMWVRNTTLEVGLPTGGVGKLTVGKSIMGDNGWNLLNGESVSKIKGMHWNGTWYFNNTINASINPARNGYDFNSPYLYKNLFGDGRFILLIGSSASTRVIDGYIWTLYYLYFYQKPESTASEYGSRFYLDVNATSSTNEATIDKYWIDDNINFTINSDIIENNSLLELGLYWLNISVNDSSNRINSTRINITVQDTIAPDVQEVKPNNNVYNFGNNITFSLNATDRKNITAVLNITYPNSSTEAVFLTKNGNQYLNTWIVPNLAGQYNLSFTANDTSNNKNTTASFFNTDNSNPIISTILVSTSTTSTTITWNTDELANATILYGNSTTLIYELSNNQSNATYSLNHSITITGLKELTAYFYNITSYDQYGNKQTNGTYFTITSYTGTTPPSGGGGGSSPTLASQQNIDKVLGNSFSSYVGTLSSGYDSDFLTKIGSNIQSSSTPPIFRQQGDIAYIIATIREGAGFYQYYLDKNSKRTKELVLYNIGKAEVTIKLTCENNFKEIDVCSYVSLSKDTLVLPANEFLKEYVKVTINSPPEAEYSQNYAFNIVAEDNTGFKDKISFIATISQIGFFGEFYEKMGLTIYRTSINNKDLNISYFFPIAILSILISLVVTAIRKREIEQAIPLFFVFTFVGFLATGTIVTLWF